jgi:hypothetical protein
MLAKNRFVQIQHLAIRPVADGVRAKLKAVVDSQLGRLPNVGQFLHIDPASIRRILRQVGVRLEQPRPARAQRTVHVFLDGAHRQMIAAHANHVISPQVRRQLGLRRPQHHPHPQPQFALLRHLPKQIHGGEATTPHLQTS